MAICVSACSFCPVSSQQSRPAVTAQVSVCASRCRVAALSRRHASIRAFSARTDSQVQTAIVQSKPSQAKEQPEQPVTWWQQLAGPTARMLGTMALVAAIALTSPADALAARSGGRIGGSAGFSSRSSGMSSRSFGSASSSSSSYSRSFSAPHSAAGGSLRAAPPPTSYAPGSARPGGSGLQLGLGFSPSWGFNSWGFGGLGYGGYPGAVGPGVVVAPPSAVVVHRGVTAVDVISRAVLAVVVFSAVLNMVSLVSPTRRRQGRTDSGSVAHAPNAQQAGHVTVHRVQVGLLGLARGLKLDLDALAATADTETARGLQLVLQETVLALLRNQDFCVLGASQSSRLSSPQEAERAWGSLTLGERAAFQEETLSNVGGRGITSRRLAPGPGDGEVDEMLVCTLLVAERGGKPLPRIRTQAQLKEALRQMGGVAAADLIAVEVLWTPQADGDALSQQEVAMQYPDLTPL